MSARDLGLRFRYWSEGDQFWGELNGPLPIMFALRAYLPGEFKTYAAAYPLPPDRRQRDRIATRLLSEFDKGLDGIARFVHETSERFGGVPSSILFDYGGKSHLARPLRSLTNTLILDLQGRISQSVVIEEVHTVLELLLKAHLGDRAKGLSFMNMVETAAADGVLEHSEVDDLRKLNQYRRDAKHRGQGVDPEEASRLIVEGNGAIQELLAELRSSSNET